jgi:hypothetical protein
MTYEPGDYVIAPRSILLELGDKLEAANAALAKAEADKARLMAMLREYSDAVDGLALALRVYELGPEGNGV